MSCVEPKPVVKSTGTRKIKLKRLSDSKGDARKPSRTRKWLGKHEWARLLSLGLRAGFARLGSLRQPQPSGIGIALSGCAAKCFLKTRLSITS